MLHYIGIDLGGTAIKVGITDETGHILCKTTEAVSAKCNANALIDAIAQQTLALIEQSSIPSASIAGIGIGAPGVPDPETGRLLYAVNLQTLNNVLLAPAIERIVRLPAFIENDANAMISGEYSFGSAKGCRNCIGLTIGTGVGGGIIIDGQLYHGASFSAGELGHITIDANGLLCNCGNYGCIERYIGRDGIVNRFKASLAKGLESSIHDHLEEGAITPKAIATAAAMGDTLALEVMDETGRLLGVVLATLVNIFNPDIIVIGGGIANAGEILFAPARREMVKRAYAIPAQRVRVVQAQFLNDAGIIGSASIAYQRLDRRQRATTEEM